MKAVVAAFNQEKALVGAFSVITNLRMELFEALNTTHVAHGEAGPADRQLLTSPARPPLCCSAVCWAAASGATRTEAALW